MKELSLHVLDILQNALQAKAKLIQLRIIESTIENKLVIIVEDDGVGMSEELLKKVSDPFSTTRTTRRVGLGLSLLQAATQRCQGDFRIDSEKGKGTRVEASFQYDHIDRAPLGDMAETIESVLVSLENCELIYFHQFNEREFIFDTREIKKVLGEEISLWEPEVMQWIKEYIQEGLTNLYGGA
ncbi:ATP-binding protein [Garciella nitratireducens]|uniref:histidine kinase n=1 Tax=Garciella nitratireducens DSM 15102 TaxID=1121911 RepID=A0A1T4L199_9FIRM|nr:ATP-binding protein [Garciella nitratireducens]RBP36415.1 histidine kinase/DNA gyrase B/HSP90-like ATPase [Garciella nitratireducens]SJZ48310.1 Histidine kinase-, DNA gyrase B-, and HSP90-like ATPase [Garciella nitratireducens DSM 15102]